MNSQDVHEAVKNLKQFLLDEYGWDTDSLSNLPITCSPTIEKNCELGIYNIPTYISKPHDCS